MKVGSVRVFTTDQNLDRQLEALEIAEGKGPSRYSWTTCTLHCMSP